MFAAVVATLIASVQGLPDAAADPAVVVHIQAQKPAQSTPLPESIGVATMEADGTLVLRVHAYGPGGVHGEGQLRYATSHPKYREILAHVGPLKPGEFRSVPPWPD